jgi:hypothetical protein
MRIKPEVVNGVDEALVINCHLHFGGSRSLTTNHTLVQSRDIITRDTMISLSTVVIFVKGVNAKILPSYKYIHNTIKQSA